MPPGEMDVSETDKKQEIASKIGRVRSFKGTKKGTDPPCNTHAQTRMEPEIRQNQIKNRITNLFNIVDSV